jgi:nucleotide-binding universal stress UspA family protein
VSTVSPARVLIAHDGSRGADVAIRLARSVAWSDGTRIRIVTAIEGDLPPLTGDPRAAEPTVDPAEAPGAAAELLRRDGVAVDSVVRRGQPAAAIIGEAEAFDANLIVVGSRGFGQVRALLMGSVAASVVDGARCPVLVARVPTIRTVLLATDGSESSTAATHAVARWSIFERASIHVLTVATGLPQYGDPSPVGGMPGAAETARQQRVADLAVATLRAAGRDALPNVRAGDAITRIVGFAESRSVDLIVIGSRGNTGLKRALAGSVARGVLMAARTSVLIVRVYPSGD